MPSCIWEKKQRDERTEETKATELTRPFQILNIVPHKASVWTELNESHANKTPQTTLRQRPSGEREEKISTAIYYFTQLSVVQIHKLITSQLIECQINNTRFKRISCKHHILHQMRQTASSVTQRNHKTTQRHTRPPNVTTATQLTTVFMQTNSTGE